MTVPALTAAGANFFDVPLPAENKPMSTPAKLASVSSCTRNVLAAELQRLAGRARRREQLELLAAGTCAARGSRAARRRRRPWRRRSRRRDSTIFFAAMRADSKIEKRPETKKPRRRPAGLQIRVASCSLSARNAPKPSAGFFACAFASRWNSRPRTLAQLPASGKARPGRHRKHELVHRKAVCIRIQGGRRIALQSSRAPSEASTHATAPIRYLARSGACWPRWRAARRILAAARPAPTAYSCRARRGATPICKACGRSTSLNGTPVQRPESFGERRFLTDEEFAERVERLARAERALRPGDRRPTRWASATGPRWASRTG